MLSDAKPAGKLQERGRRAALGLDDGLDSMDGDGTGPGVLGCGVPGVPERINGLIGVSGPAVRARGLNVEVGAPFGGEGPGRLPV